MLETGLQFVSKIDLQRYNPNSSVDRLSQCVLIPMSTGDHVETYKLVMPEHLNHFGYLFGGYLLKWVDEVAWIAATLEHPNCKFVTIAMDEIEFRQSVTEGTILRFHSHLKKLGNTSVQYLVSVTKGNEPHQESNPVFVNTVTMVRVDEQGNKKPLSE